MTVSEQLDFVAARAVEELGIESEIVRLLDSLRVRIEECDEIAETAMENRDVALLAYTLPIANGVIHFAANRRRLKQAIEWVKDHQGAEQEIDAVSMLSTLTLVYIIREAADAVQEPRERRRWLRIYDRVARVIESV